MDKKITNHTKILKPLSVVSFAAVFYLIHGAGLESSDFWKPVFSIFWLENNVVMPDVEFVEQLFKFLLNII